MTLFGTYTLFTSHPEAMAFFEFFKDELQGKNRKIESTPLGLIKYLDQDRPEQFRGANPYTFGYLIRG